MRLWLSKARQGQRMLSSLNSTSRAVSKLNRYYLKNTACLGAFHSLLLTRKNVDLRKGFPQAPWKGRKGVSVLLFNWFLFFHTGKLILEDTNWINKTLACRPEAAILHASSLNLFDKGRKSWLHSHRLGVSSVLIASPVAAPAWPVVKDHTYAIHKMENNYFFSHSLIIGSSTSSTEITNEKQANIIHLWSSRWYIHISVTSGTKFVTQN